MRILVGDIGGTKTLLALYEGPDARSLRETRRERYANATRDALGPILHEFLRDAPGDAPVDASVDASVDAAVFGVAGPVDDDVCRATNLPWIIDARQLEQALSIPRAGLINDFEAVALGLDELPPESLVVLQDRPVDPLAPRAVLGAGTGLGEAILIAGDDLPRVLATEGGHVDFAPRDEAEIALLRFALERHGRVSVERLVSGPGLALIYDHVVAAGLAPATDALRDVPEAEDRSALIGRAGLSGEDPGARIALERFVSLYGSEAGDLALKCLPFGGLYVAGGIAPKIIDALRAGDFMKSFHRKGRMTPLLERMRVSVVMDPAVGLLGARRKAVALLSSR